MRKKIITKITLGILAGTVLYSMVGCTSKVKSEDFMKDIKTNQKGNGAVTEFAVKLFRASHKEKENTLLSPLSVLYALAMTTNGAQSETLSEMETVLGMTTDELNSYLYHYMEDLPQNEKYKLNLANAIWFQGNEYFQVSQEFLQTTIDYYDAEIYQAAFEQETCNEINSWVEKKTDGMISKILDKISEEAIMYLINALTFDAEWEEIYAVEDIQKGLFIMEDGAMQDANFMFSQENVYLEDENTTGFMKYYKDGQYAFVGLLPKEGIMVEEYVASLTGENVQKLLKNRKETLVSIAIPEFEIEDSREMSEILKNMGMVQAFDAECADFGKMGTVDADGNVYISCVLHKTHLAVSEKGTKAGTSTVVEMMFGSGSAPVEQKKVYLNRPFVYMVIECENNTPIFIGNIMNVK